MFFSGSVKFEDEYEFYSRKGFPTGTGNSIYRELTPFYADEHLDIIKKSGIRLDDLFEPDSEFDLIKIDTQGSELDIIKGGLKAVKKASYVILEVPTLQYNEESPLFDEVIDYMKQIGFSKYEIVDEHKWMDEIEDVFPYGSVFQVDIVFSKQ